MSFFSSDFSFVSLNARGLRDSIKRKSIFLFCKNQKSQCYLLQETHSNYMDEKFWSNQWGDKILFNHGTNRSAGVAILLNNFPGKVLTSNRDPLGHWILCVLEANEDFMIIGNIYGCNNPNQNRSMIAEISKTIKSLIQRYPTDNLIFGGDYNMVMDEWLDRSPSKYQMHSFNPVLLEFCNMFNLKDAWRFDNPNTQTYTWFKPDDTIKSRIDFQITGPV